MSDIVLVTFILCGTILILCVLGAVLKWNERIKPTQKNPILRWNGEAWQYQNGQGFTIIVPELTGVSNPPEESSLSEAAIKLVKEIANEHRNG